MAVKSSAAVLLHIGLVNRRSVRFFAPPLEGLDMPWSALGDLARRGAAGLVARANGGLTIVPIAFAYLGVDGVLPTLALSAAGLFAVGAAALRCMMIATAT